MINSEKENMLDRAEAKDDSCLAAVDYGMSESEIRKCVIALCQENKNSDA